MSNDVMNAKESIRQILSGLAVKTVVCIDDIYVLDKYNVESVIGLLSLEEAQTNPGKYMSLLPGVPLDANNDEVWKRALRQYWDTLTDTERKVLLDDISRSLDYSGDIEKDLQSASLLRDLIPEGIDLIELGPAEWSQSADETLHKGTLFLFDHNLRHAGYSDAHGLTLLDSAISAHAGQPVICGLLTHTATETNERSRNEALAKQIHRERSEFLVLSKDRLSDPIRFAHGLKMMSLNYARDSLSTEVGRIAAEAADCANKELMNVDIYDFDYMVLDSSKEEGIWEAETLFRLFEIVRRDEFRRSAFDVHNRAALDQRISQIRRIHEVDTIPGEDRYPSAQRWKIRCLELYENGQFINEAHLPLELGDIFQIGKSKYILLAQPCDLMVRDSSGGRVEVVSLVKITENAPENPSSGVSFTLDWFSESGKKAYVKFRSRCHVAVIVLDLAVFNHDGSCRLDFAGTVPPILHSPWKQRFLKVKRHFQKHRKRINTLLDSITKASIPGPARKLLEESLVRQMTLSDLKISLDYEQIKHDILAFGIRRIGRYRQPDAMRLLSSYFAFLNRSARELDYASPEYIANGVWRCPSSERALYVGSEKKGSKFHRRDCRYARQIPSESRLCFESQDCAVKYGHQPCKVCKPTET
ncbi:MAG: hypothetical protein ACYTEQ_04115 [Planctomycetota bacterium]|jgi:hypothetical protein